MDFSGLHHVTAVTANAKQNLAFYTTVLGLRLVKKTVNQDNPTVYQQRPRWPGLPAASILDYESPVKHEFAVESSSENHPAGRSPRAFAVSCAAYRMGVKSPAPH